MTAICYLLAANILLMFGWVITNVNRPPETRTVERLFVFRRRQQFTSTFSKSAARFSKARGNFHLNTHIVGILDGNIVFASSNGLYQYIIEDDSWERLSSEKIRKNSFQSTLICPINDTAHLLVTNNNVNHTHSMELL